MSKRKQASRQPILILSGHPSFAPGVLSLLEQTRKTLLPDARLVSTPAEALNLMRTWLPELLILDHEDAAIDREHLQRELAQRSYQVELMLITLHPSGAIVVHDRERTSAPQATLQPPAAAVGNDPSNDQPIHPNGVSP